MGLQVVLVDELPMDLKEVSHEMRFERLADARKPIVFPYKVRPRTSDWSTWCWCDGVARRSRVWSDHSRIGLGSFPHCRDGRCTKACVSCIQSSSTEFHRWSTFAVRRVRKWGLQVVWSDHCRWNSIVICNSRIGSLTVNGMCKWCWWMSCRSTEFHCALQL